MGIHESSVNFQNLINDLAEMYPFDVSEVIVVELVANSLDAGASIIRIDFNEKEKILQVLDNGKGMNKLQFDEYHDFAAGLKTRGIGIGFAGVGAKISFNIADRVVTETKSIDFEGGSNWYLQSKKKLLWEDISQPTSLLSYGTKVKVFFRPEASLSYNNKDDIIKILRKHYLPLFDETFLKLYEKLSYYSNNLRFIVNGETISPGDIVEDYSLDKVKTFFPSKSGKKIGYGVFGLSEFEYPLGSDTCGVLLATHGKVIKSELFNQFPGSFGPKILGLVEVPDFVKFLTTSKTNFIHGRGKFKDFESLFGPIRNEFKSWLSDLGVQTSDYSESDEAIKLEKELKKIIDEIPELSEFFGFHTKKEILLNSIDGDSNASLTEGVEKTFPIGGILNEGNGSYLDQGDEEGNSLVNNPEEGKEKALPISRISKKGPKISFISNPDKIDLAWVDGNYVVINSGHPSFLKAKTNASNCRLHCLFSISTAIQRYLSTQEEIRDLMFIDRLMAAWGRK